MIRSGRAAALTLGAVSALLLAAGAAGAAVPIELVSAPAPGAAGPAADACDLSIECLDFEASADGSRAFFSTTERLVAGDLDASKDVYERVGGTTLQLSTGLPGGNGNFDATLQGISSDGSRALFATYESLTRDDLDITSDVYERGSEVRLVSTGPASSSLQLDVCAQGSLTALACIGLAGAAGGTPVFFTTPESLTFDDLDAGCLSAPQPCLDVYRRSGDTTTLVSAGTNAGHGAVLLAASRDGGHVLFGTKAPLTAGDGDAAFDVYERVGGTVRLVSGAAGPGAPIDVVNDVRISADGTHALFATAERLSAGDADSAVDLYERAGGATTLVSEGNGATDVCDPVEGCAGLEVSTDGARVLFESADPLVAQDGDLAVDVYERSGGRLTLVSAGATGEAPAYLDFASADGRRVVFSTAARLVPGDTDGAVDVYERAGGVTRLVSDGPRNGNGQLAATAERISAAGSRIVFSTVEALVPEDTDEAIDLYVRAGGETYLVSGGSADEGVLFLDMSDVGDRVFFATAERLAAGDVDARLDVYAADLRGLPEPVEEEPPPIDPPSDPPGDPPTEPADSPGGSGGAGGGASGGGAQAAAPAAVGPATQSAPRARLSAAFGRKARASRSGFLALRVRCAGAGACKGRVVLRPGSSKRFTAAAGRTVSVRVKLSRAARRALARGRRVRVTATVQTLGPAGKPLASLKRRVTVTPPAQRRR